MTRLNELLGTEFPIVQGGMANIATAEFAAAVSNAGALGLIGGGGMDAAGFRESIRRCRTLTDRPFGVNIMLMHPQAEEMADIARIASAAVLNCGTPSEQKYSACLAQSVTAKRAVSADFCLRICTGRSRREEKFCRCSSRRSCVCMTTPRRQASSKK